MAKRKLESMSQPWVSNRVGSAIAGENPTVLAALDASFAAIGDVQWLPGYTVVLTNQLQVDRLSDLSRIQRIEYLCDVELVAAAVERVCTARDPEFRRVNIEILGNQDSFLHTHIWPRYEWEPDGIKTKPVWLYPASNWSNAELALGSRHDDLRRALTKEIAQLRRRESRD